MTKKLRSIFSICAVCSLLFTSCAKEGNNTDSVESTTISSSENIQTDQIAEDTTVTENTTAITTIQEHTYDELSTCAGTLEEPAN